MARLVTKEGLEKLQKEYDERTNTLRHEIAAAIKEAKEQGDLSENAEYTAAKEQQAENEARIAQLEAMIKEVRVVEHDDSDDSAQIGSKVTVKIKNQEMIFEIVGSNEADPMQRKISNESPIGKALIGTHVGDTINVDTPSGPTQYEILSINPA